jgi:hypothetical protein
LAVPVAYKTTDANHNLQDNLGFLDRAVHEWEGLIAYRLTGKINVLLPSPRSENIANAQGC